MNANELIDDFAVEKAAVWAKGTITLHTGRVKRFCLWLSANYELADIRLVTIAHLTDYFNSLRDKSYFTRKASFEALRLFFRYLKQSNKVEWNIFEEGVERKLLRSYLSYTT